MTPRFMSHHSRKFYLDLNPFYLQQQLIWYLLLFLLLTVGLFLLLLLLTLTQGNTASSPPSPLSSQFHTHFSGFLFLLTFYSLPCSEIIDCVQVSHYFQ